MQEYLTPTNLFISLLFLGTTSFSLYLTPPTLTWKSPFRFLEYFLLISIAVVGVHMTLPFFFQWKLPLQQGLGSNADLLARGVLISAASLFAVIVKNRCREGALPFIAALALLAVGAPELFRILAILNSTVNGILNYGNVPMGSVIGYVYPFLILFLTDASLIFLGALSLFSHIYRAVRA